MEVLCTQANERFSVPETLLQGTFRFPLKKNPDPTTAPLTIIALEKLNKLKKYKDARF